MTGALHHQVSVERAWRDACEITQECADELEHATSMGNKGRMAQCEQWLAEAQDLQERAFKRMDKARTRGIYGVAKSNTHTFRGKATKRSAL